MIIAFWFEVQVWLERGCASFAFRVVASFRSYYSSPMTAVVRSFLALAIFAGRVPCALRRGLLMRSLDFACMRQTISSAHKQSLFSQVFWVMPQMFGACAYSGNTCKHLTLLMCARVLISPAHIGAHIRELRVQRVSTGGSPE